MLQFTDATELKAHYAQIKSKFREPMPPKKVYMTPIVEEPPNKVLPPVPAISQHLLDQYHLPFVNSSKSRMTAVIRETAEKHGLTEKELMAATRKVNVVKARQEAIYRIRHEVQKSMSEIGRFFNKDHTTILHALEKHVERIKADA